MMENVGFQRTANGDPEGVSEVCGSRRFERTAATEGLIIAFISFLYDNLFLFVLHSIPFRS